jgi:membrane-bound serine protease (ClpP class)
VHPHRSHGSQFLFWRRPAGATPRFLALRRRCAPCRTIIIRVRAAAILAIALAIPIHAAPKVIAVNVDGVVHPITAEIVNGALDRAKRENASLLLVRLDTPGGLMDAMRSIVQSFDSSPVPVVTFVTPSGARAASAGFFLLEAGDIAVMAPGTNSGAAHPVAMGGEMDAVMSLKVENDAAAYLRSICDRRGRNSALAETAVRESKSFTEKEALDQHLIELISSDKDLMASLDGRVVTRFDGSKITLHTAGAEIETYSPTWRERIISAVADPNIALLLLVVGGLCIYLEFSSPGVIAPGVIGAILVLVGLTALSVLPISWLGAALILLAFTLFALEAKFAAHGVLGVGGTVSMVLGAVMLIDSPWPSLRIHWTTAIGLALPFSAITIFLMTMALRARRNKVTTGAQGMIGQSGTALTALEPNGTVFVHGEYWDAVSSRPAAAGARIRVTAIDRLRLSVEPAPDKEGGLSTPAGL